MQEQVSEIIIKLSRVVFCDVWKGFVIVFGEKSSWLWEEQNLIIARKGLRNNWNIRTIYGFRKEL